MFRKIQLAFSAQYFRHDNAMLMMNGHNEVETVFKIAFLNPFEKLISAFASINGTYFKNDDDEF